MQILKNRVLTVLLVALLLSTLPIMYASSSGMSVVLFVAALLIIAKSANAAAKIQGDAGLWVDAEWNSCEEKKTAVHTENLSAARSGTGEDFRNA